MTIEIRETDHARLVELAEARGDSDVSKVVSDALQAYFDLQRRQGPEGAPKVARKSRWAEVARFHRENPSLEGKSEEVNRLIHEFREG